MSEELLQESFKFCNDLDIRQKSRLNAKKTLSILGFFPKSGSASTWSKSYKGGYLINVLLNEDNLEGSTIDYGSLIKVNRVNVCNFEREENLVVLECVNRLLEKGYNPKSIELEKGWKLGHKGKGYLDILVKDKNGQSFLMIECKNWGESFNAEKKNMLKDGGQLLSYYRQDRSAKFLCLYASRVRGDKIHYTNEIITTNKLQGENDIEIFDSWDNTFDTKGIFESGIKVYDLKNTSLTYGDLEDLEKSDGQTVFHQFAQILRRHVVSDQPNAFNKIFNLFICKIQDEDERANKPNEDLLFQCKKGQTHEELIDNLKRLYSDGLRYYLKIITPCVTKEMLKRKGGLKDEQINEILYYRDSQDFSFKDVHNKDTFAENAEIVKEVVRLLQKYRIKYTSKHQYLGDFFELLLNSGFKQESGQYFTPVPLTRFICKSLPIKEIIDRKNNSDNREEKIKFLPYVIDYASGSGHFITEMMDEIDCYVQNIRDEDIRGGRNAIKELKRKNLEWARDYIYAIEKDYRLVKISKVSSFLNGDGDANVIYADGLSPLNSKKYEGVLKTNKAKENNSFDILVANPPYSVNGFKNALIKEYGGISNLEDNFELAKHLTDNSSEIECLFVERAKQLLKEKSVAGIILPVSLLTSGGIYKETRALILEHFKVKAIVLLGNNTFMATNTRTVILFLEKRRSVFDKIKKVVSDFFISYRDVACEGIENIFSKYVKDVYEGLSFDGYISVMRGVPNEEAKGSGLLEEYKGMSIEDTITLEKEKALYFIVGYSQKVVIADSGEKNTEKEFLGYEFSSRRGHEGIKIQKDEGGKSSSKLYNENFAELGDKTKLNSYILRSFRDDRGIEDEIAQIQSSEDHSLSDHIQYTRLSKLFSFDGRNFDKSINLGKKKSLTIESKWEAIRLGKIATILDNKREPLSAAVRSNMKGNIPYYGANGVVDHINSFVFEDDLLLVAEDGGFWGGNQCTTYLIEGRSWVNNHAHVLKFENDYTRKYIHYILNYLDLSIYITGSTRGKLTLTNLKAVRIPLPPLETQQKIVNEINEVENKVEEAKSMISKSQEEIRLLLNAQKFPLKRLKEVCIINQATELIDKQKTYSYIDITSVEDGGSGVINITKKIEGKNLPSRAKRKANIGDVLMSTTRPHLKAFSFLETMPPNPIVSTGFAVLTPKSNMRGFFLYMSLLSDFVSSQVINKMNKTTYPSINTDEIKSLKIPVPPLDVQDAMLKKISVIEQKIEKEKLFLNKAPQEKQKILFDHIYDV